MTTLKRFRLGYLRHVITFVLMLMVVNVSTSAQSYQKGNQIYDSTIVFKQKRTFELAGDKLMIVKLNQDTVAKIQRLSLELYNSDLTVFKTFEKVVPLDDYLTYFHNGIDVMEIVVDGKPTYFWRYSMEKYINNAYINLTTVMSEKNDSIFSFPVSFHGAKTFVNGNKLKITGEQETSDTIRYEKDGWYGWYTISFLTGSVYDVQTGQREVTFPRGTFFQQVATVNDSAHILTENNNLTQFLYGHPSGSLATCMKSTVYNMDYTVLKELDYDFSSMGIPVSDISYTQTYLPLSDGHRLFYLHNIGYYIKEPGTQVVLEQRNRYFLTDKNGNLIKSSEKETTMPSGALWLPTTQETVLFNYNGVLISNATMDSIGSYRDYIVTNEGAVYFVNVTSDSVHVLTDQLRPFKSFACPTTDWYFSDISQKSVAKDSLLEFVFTNGTNGVKVINENGRTVVNEPDKVALMDFTQYTPLFLLNQDNKYGNLIDDSLACWYRTTPLNVLAKRENEVYPIDIQLFKQEQDRVVLIDSVNATGIFEKPVSEGTYFVRTMGTPQTPGTYYPSALIWEEASSISVTTDSLVNLTIIQQPNFETPSNGQNGLLEGTIANTLDSLTLADMGQLQVYVRNSSDKRPIARETPENGAFAFTTLPYGTLEVVVDAPGKRHINNTSFVMQQGNKSNAVLTLDKSGIHSRLATAVTKLGKQAFTLSPNPATEFIHIDQSMKGSTLELIDLAGRTVLSTRLINDEVRIGHLPKGLYVVKIQTAQEKFVSSLIKY